MSDSTDKAPSESPKDSQEDKNSQELPKNGAQEPPHAPQSGDEDNIFDLFDSVKNVPLKVSEIQVEGFERTHPDVVFRELDNVRRDTTLDQLKDDLLDSVVAYEELGIFSSIDLELLGGDEDVQDSCRVVVNVQEKGVFTGKAQTFVQGNEGGVEGHVGFLNHFGRAEKFRISTEFGSKRSTEYAIEYLKPRIKGLPLSFETRVFSLFRAYEDSSYADKMNGLAFALKSSGGRHSLGYEFGWKHLTDPSLRASRPIQLQLGHKLKSALSYSFFINELEPVDGRPETGFAARWGSELGGLHPEASVQKHMKHRLDAEFAFPISPIASVSLGISGGLLLPLYQDYLNRTTNISDRFFLGGVDSLRGFKFKGCGPSAPCRARDREPNKRDAVGGDLMWAGKGAVNFDLPGRAFKALGIYGQLFGNVGNIVLVSGTGRSFMESFEEVRSSFRSSVGVGLVWPNAWGTFELNYVWPTRRGQHDRVQQGLQMGFASKVLYRQ